MSLYKHEITDFSRTSAGLLEVSCLTLAAALPNVTLLCMFVLGWTGNGSAAVVVGVCGAIAAVPAGYFALSSLQKSWGTLPGAWIAQGIGSWTLLLLVLVLVLALPGQ